MAKMMSTGTDVVAFLKEQHQQIRALFDQVTAAHGKEREKSFYALRRLLAVHETAEEEIIHPAARRALPNGASIIDARLSEEREAKKLLAELEKLDAASAEFEAKLATLKVNVIAHAEAEEREEFGPLGNQLEPSRLQRMRKAAEIAEAVAPTRPHPGVESAAANLIAGPLASMIDRMRDAISGKA